MTHVVATINLKGGVGKTTITAALAETLSGEFGKRVLLIDLDPQTNLTIMMIGEQRWGELDAAGLTLAALFEEALGDRTGSVNAEALIDRQVSPLSTVTSVNLLPSSLRLIALQDRVTDIGAGHTEVLARALKPVLADYDYVLIDCPPNLGAMTLNGLRLADAYLIPTIPDVMSTYGIGPVQERIRQFADEWGRSIVELGVVVTKYRQASAVHRTTVDDLNRNKQISMVFPSLIPEANQIAAAAEFTDFGTLRKKYGNDGQFAALRDLAQDFIATTKVRLAWV